MSFDPICCILSLFFTGISAYLDIKKYQISNKLCLAALLTALFISVYRGGVGGLVFFAGGAVPPILFLYPAFCISAIGAGDVKVLLCAGSFFGWWLSVLLVFLSLLCGAAQSIYVLTKNKIWGERFSYLISFVRGSVYGTKQPYMEKGRRVENIPFCLSVFIANLILCGGLYCGLF